MYLLAITVKVPHITAERRRVMLAAFPELEVLGTIPIVETRPRAVRIAEDRVKQKLKTGQAICMSSVSLDEAGNYVVRVKIEESSA